MDAQRLGSVFRAVRIRKGWRQADLAASARVSTATISRIECGTFEGLSIGTLLRVAAASDIRIDWLPRWRGGELDRMMNAGHAATSVSCWVLLRDTPSNHRRLAAHATVLRHAFPADGRRMRAWLRRPLGAVAALSFLSDSHVRKASGAVAGVQRVRRRGPSVGSGWNVP